MRPPGLASLAAALAALLVSGTTVAQSEFFSLSASVRLESGDTWSLAGKRYRLYGVQSCLRGTTYSDLQDRKRDCEEASLAVLAAFIRDTRPDCAPIARNPELTYVVCYALVGGRRLDLGTMMISEGYGFAALDIQGLPVNPAYAVAEQEARARKAGLWQFPDVRHPSILMGKALDGKRGDR